MALDPDVLARLGLDEFIAVDLETTGLHPITDEIIEFGAVQFRNGRPVEGVSQLIRPKQALPPVITTITGITQEELALAPDAASA
ncbi:MAG TPA: exonuclease domain-containing protein, partial [Candidatus Bipolaricaulota bacterium]